MSFKNVGYFYNDFDAIEGAKQLKKAILNFDYNDHKNKYLNKIESHSTDNKSNQERIENLIKELIK